LLGKDLALRLLMLITLLLVVVVGAAECWKVAIMIMKLQIGC
jgi:hypothetical protein